MMFDKSDINLLKNALSTRTKNYQQLISKRSGISHRTVQVFFTDGKTKSEKQEIIYQTGNQLLKELIEKRQALVTQCNQLLAKDDEKESVNS